MLINKSFVDIFFFSLFQNLIIAILGAQLPKFRLSSSFFLI